MKRKLLLLSNSTNSGEDYLGWPEQYIKSFLPDNIQRILFIPWAGVTIAWDSYTKIVTEKFESMGYHIDAIHDQKDPIKAVLKAEAIMIGGGNTFNLVYHLHKSNIIAPIREKITTGTPFIGWSAGSNVACPTLMTTNDMPVIEPKSFETLHLVPFQINPHYTELTLEGHGGETREMRINEYIEINKEKIVLGLPEGSLLQVEGMNMTMKGSGSLKIFQKDMPIKTASPGNNLDRLLES